MVNLPPIASNNHTDYGGDAPVLEVTIILAVLIVLCVLGNSLVCCAFVIQPRLRRVLYYPLLSLAIADILCGLVAMTSYLAKKHVFGGKKEQIVCDVSRFSYFVTEYASVLSLTVISIERSLSIFRPLTHQMTVTSKRMKCVLGLVWCDAILVACLPFFWQKPGTSSQCTFRPTKTWSVMVITTNVLLPFLVILASQTAIYTIAIKLSIVTSYQKRVVRGRLHGQPRCNKSVWADAWKTERKATITLSSVVGLFLFTWGPSCVYYFLQIVSPQRFEGVFGTKQGLFNAVVKLLTFSNSCFNPMVYAWLNRDFREAFLRVLSQRLHVLSVGKPARVSKNKSRPIRRHFATTEENDALDSTLKNEDAI